ncbi:hypothetical protein A3H26_00095 [candidate division WWE3 bacterium RIFCSPLOWO2_12_FULL_36_10]|uniref:Rod shape-determining protein MreD n=1 Tax=candidate division WWE3 bacterium RIFCSPLOWO2_12_FULL_36_10 TaxID=1802630 RepID=A0A1F4VLQ6_UNCKA|nr:MAG: hypothetical protein A3H26_00095 [candidate division WWE3 bacterium RIFCSPLOWO2_12_FULL_36_10]
MVKYIVISISIFLLSLLQTSFLSELFGAKYNPNLVLAFTLSLILLGSLEFGLYSGFAGGLLIDLMGVSIFGFSSLLNVLSVLCIFYIRKTFFKGNISFSIFAFIFSFLYLVLVNLTKLGNPYLYIFPSLSTSVFVWIFYLIVKNVYKGFLKNEYDQLSFKNRL